MKKRKVKIGQVWKLPHSTFEGGGKIVAFDVNSKDEEMLGGVRFLRKDGTYGWSYRENLEDPTTKWVLIKDVETIIDKYRKNRR